MCSVDAEFSTDLGTTYAPASIIQNTHGTLAEVSCPAVGEQITIVWDLETDLGSAEPATATLRLSPADTLEDGPPAHLLIELRARAQEIGGGFVEVDSAQSTQWQYQQVGLVHLLPTETGADVTADYLSGDDGFDSNALTWRYDLPTPPPAEHFTALLDPATPGTAAFYLPFSWRETDESDTWEEGEAFAGVSDQMLVAYVRPDDEWAHEDWYVVAVDEFVPSEERFTWLPIDTDIDINLKGYPVESASLELDFTNAADVSTSRMFGIMPMAESAELSDGQPHVASTPFNPYVPTVSVDVTDELAEPLVEPGPWESFADDYVALMLYLYLDPDTDAVPGEGDLLTHHATRSSDGAWLFLAYIDATMTWDALYDWSIDDCWPGFTFVTPREPAGDAHEAWTCYSVDDPPQAAFREIE